MLVTPSTPFHLLKYTVLSAICIDVLGQWKQKCEATTVVKF